MHNDESNVDELYIIMLLAGTQISYKYGEFPLQFELIAGQGHPKLSSSVSVESAYATCH